jgi:hypothetical protein
MKVEEKVIINSNDSSQLNRPTLTVDITEKDFEDALGRRGVQRLTSSQKETILG